MVSVKNWGGLNAAPSGFVVDSGERSFGEIICGPRGRGGWSAPLHFSIEYLAFVIIQNEVSGY